eukprot:scaffold39926_cov199-Amphora_coffeaeformis.AAC.3
MASTKARTYLTKSLFQIAVSCPRKLVYASQGRRRRTETNVLLKSLAAEGRLWEAYARIKRFPDGILTTTDSTIHFANSLEKAEEGRNSMDVNEALLESLAKQTQEVLFDDKQRRPIFEGLVRHGNFLVRADVLECIPYDSITQRSAATGNNDDGPSNKRGKIRLTEIKAKSFDTQSEKDPIWSSRGGGIKADMLPYIHDAAFQTMVLEDAFPDYDVETFLLVPDKAQTNQLVGLNQLTNRLMTKPPKKASKEAYTEHEQARQAIFATNEDLSALIDITEAVQYVLKNKLEYPGGSGTTPFREVTLSWSQNLNDGNGTLASEAPLGNHCKACEFRLEGLLGGDVDDTETSSALTNESGFHQCWTERSGLAPKSFADGSVVVDMWFGQKKKINSFIANDKFLLSDLDNFDLGFSEEGLELDKKGKPVSKKSGDGMSRSRRQFYQATGIPSGAQFISDNVYMQSEMREWKYPFHLIDFETATPVLPYFSNTKAFEPIAFQFSHHILYEDGSVHHASEFLNTQPEVNPSRAFADALSQAVGNCDGSVFRWGSHENAILSKVLEASFEESDPVYEQLAPLLSGSDRSMVDLQKIATMGYYVAGSDASSSLKKVLLPTMNASTSLEQVYGEPTYSSSNFTNVQWFRRDETGAVCDPYHILREYNQSQGTVADGGAALSAYHTLLSPHVTQAERNNLEASLLRYCELDTLAMVMIIQAWQEFFLHD